MRKDLIDTLLDKRADEAERDDAAGWLREYTDNDTLSAIYQVASDKTEEEYILNKVGSVLGEILIKRDNFSNDKKYLCNLTEVAYEEAIAYIKSVKPDWINK